MNTDKKCDIICYRIKLWGQLIAYYIRKDYLITVLKHCTDVIIVEKKKLHGWSKSNKIMNNNINRFLWEYRKLKKKYYPLILHKKVPNISVKFIFQIKLLLSVMSLCLRVLRFLINLLYLGHISYFINYKMLNVRKNIHYYSYN